MPKTDGYKTKEKILTVAEQLFAEKGYNGTSIDRIAKAAGVNKGLIYYHFKDKKDLMESIAQRIILEVDQMVKSSFLDDSEVDEQSLQQKIKAEVEYCNERKRILSVMLMEALKVDGNADFLFKCAELVIQQEMDGIKNKMNTETSENPAARTQYMLHEFFTGFMPMISFVTMQEKWCKYFNCDKEKALDFFIESFTQTHLKNHQ